MRHLSGMSVLALAVIMAGPQTSFAKDKESEIFSQIDALKSSADVSKLASRLEQRTSPSELLGLLRKGRSGLTPFSAKEGTVTLTDKLGRSTKLHYVIPNGPAPADGYGILLALHGLNAPAKQLFSLYRKCANDNKWILLSPRAQRLPFGGTKSPSGRKVEANEDSFGIEPLPQWFAYRSYGLPMAAISKIKRHYKVNTNQIIMSGFSMGAYATWNLGLRYPDRFAALAPLSGSLSRREKFGIVDQKSRLLVDNGRRVPLYFVHGAKDGMVPPNTDRFCRDRLKELGGRYIYKESPQSNHGLRGWFGDAASPRALCDWMSKQRRSPAPKVVEHLTLGSYMNRSYWLEITESKSGTATIKASIASNNRIEIEAKNVKKFRVYLDSRLVKSDQPVTIICNGQTVFQGPVKASIQTVLRSWIDREDSELIYSRAVDCIVGQQTAPQTAPKKAKKPQSGATKPWGRAKGKWY
jgi:predicted esterase